jgi:hypothetical protein
MTSKSLPSRKIRLRITCAVLHTLTLVISGPRAGKPAVRWIAANISLLNSESDSKYAEHVWDSQRPDLVKADRDTTTTTRAVIMLYIQIGDRCAPPLRRNSPELDR